jgi:uncharacterized membrane protein YheB (UPF0754 family)
MIGEIVIWKLVLIPLIGAFVGYSTNVVAIKMLFHPKKPINIFGLKIQGFIPRRKKEMASAIADVVEREWVSGEDVGAILEDALARKRVDEMVGEVVKERVRRFPIRFLPRWLRDVPSDIAATGVKEITGAIAPPDILSRKIIAKAKEFDIRGYITEKIDEYEEGRLEGIISELGSRELRLIEIWGGVLGFLIGSIQVTILLLT